MRILITDTAHSADLIAYLALAGYEATRASENELRVSFPRGLDGHHARTELAVYLTAWRVGRPNVSAELIDS